MNGLAAATTAPSAARPWRRSRLLNVWIDDLTMPELLHRLDRGAVFTANLDHLWLLQRDLDFHRAYARADFVTADSKYVYWSLGWIGRRIRARLSGSDIVPAFCDHHRDDPQTRIFLLGAAPGVAAEARDRLNARAGRELVVGALGPSLRFVDDPHEIEAALQRIRDSQASVLVVGLGSPKQEIWIDRHRDALPGVRIFMGVGATIDYEAGARKRAPSWMRRTGLEWLYRTVTQPRHYALRYLRDASFFKLLLLDRLGRYRAPTFPARRA